jgi:dolichol kinase
MRHWGRKLFHLFGGLGLLAVYFNLSRELALIFYAILFVIVLILDLVRLRVHALNQFFFTRFGSFIRPNEATKLTGTPPYILGIGLSLFFFRTDVAAAAICFLAFGDVAATTVGERYGNIKIGRKSLEGTLAFIVAAAGAGLLLLVVGIALPTGIIMLGTLVAASVELLPLPVNDNLVIPLVAGGVMESVLLLMGPA